MSAIEPNVVCGQCGAEVSAFVTECPYCGARVRKRAPQLERRGDEITPSKHPDHSRRKPLRRVRRPKIRLPQISSGRPWATLLTVAASVVLLLVGEAGDLNAVDLGGIVGPVDGSEWWRYLAAPFVYDDAGYLFVCSSGILIFGIASESRIGALATAVSIIACGSLGLLLGIWIGDSLGAGGVSQAWGGNAVALGLLASWSVIRAFEMRRQIGGDIDLIGAVVCAAVLILLSVVIEPASILVAISGAMVGAIFGALFSTASSQPTAGPR